MALDPHSPIASFVEAAQDHDVPTLVALMAPEVVLRSPITSRFAFRGRRQLTDLMHDVYATLPDQRYVADVGDARTRALRGVATIDGMELEEVLMIEVDDAGLVAGMEVFVRPMPAVVALAARLGPRVAGRRSRGRGIAAKAMFAPLAFALRRGEGLGARLAQPADR